MTKKLEPPPADFDENPEWTDEDFARAKPFREVHPEFYAVWEKNRGGRPRVENPKLHLGVRMAADVVNGLRATGRGYSVRLENLIREALAQGKL